MSFNYGTTANNRGKDITQNIIWMNKLLINIRSTDKEATRQLTNANYGICIRMTLDYCSIEWSQVNKDSFTVSNDTGGLDDNIIGNFSQ